jgi:hypothetical protein
LAGNRVKFQSIVAKDQITANGEKLFFKIIKGGLMKSFGVMVNDKPIKVAAI